MDLFEAAAAREAPLADRMRPRTLDEFIGQQHLIGPGRLLRRAIEADRLTSSIFYGPPGCGKTSLATVIANVSDAHFERLNAVTAGVSEVREVIKDAENRRKLYNKPTYLLLDEIHRWSKTQSDSILPALEKGIIRLIGSTTENPYIYMTPALVSRCRLFEFLRLNDEDVRTAMEGALADTERGYGNIDIILQPEAMAHICSIANGDIRSALNALELAVLTTRPNEQGQTVIDLEVAQESIQKRVLQCDESMFYDMLSAFCKSLRGSDSDAALAWAARLLHAGVDPRIIARRIVAHASEDVGLAEPMALLQALAALEAVDKLGMPECRLALSQAIIFVCEAPKSNSVLSIYSALEEVGQYRHEPVPQHLRDTNYKGAAKLGSGQGYKYAHDYPDHYVQQEYMPPAVKGHKYYTPSDSGYERVIKQNRKEKGID